MHSTGSVLYTILERMRGIVDEPTSKWTNDWLIRHVVVPETANVWGRLSLNYDNPVIHRFSVDLAVDTEYYTLPPNIHQIWRVAELDSSGRILRDWRPEGEFHPRGPGWRIEGNVLAFRPYPQETRTWEIWHTSNGDFMPHYATTGTLADVDSETVQLTMASSPTIGSLDRRANSYVGAMLRVLPAAGVWEERIIETHDPATRIVTVRTQFDVNVPGAIAYEVSPPGMTAIASAVAYSGALQLATMKNVSQKQYNMIANEYRKALKTVGDNLSNMMLRKGKRFEQHTIDNPDRRAWFLS